MDRGGSTQRGSRQLLRCQDAEIVAESCPDRDEADAVMWVKPEHWSSQGPGDLRALLCDQPTSVTQSQRFRKGPGKLGWPTSPAFKENCRTESRDGEVVGGHRGAWRGAGDASQELRERLCRWWQGLEGTKACFTFP